MGLVNTEDLPSKTYNRRAVHRPGGYGVPTDMCPTSMIILRSNLHLNTDMAVEDLHWFSQFKEISTEPCVTRRNYSPRYRQSSYEVET